jgi:hypothetical protein
MRVLLQFIALVLIVGCSGPTDTTPPPVTPPAANIDTTKVVALVPLTGSGLRFDGVYHYSDRGVEYYMRFFERGNAAFVGGTEKYPGQLAELLTENVQSGWNQVHNCPVVQRNDSLFIRSVGFKGVINYLGEVRADGDSVRFVKASEITGTVFKAPYAFLPDGVSGK